MGHGASDGATARAGGWTRRSVLGGAIVAAAVAVGACENQTVPDTGPATTAGTTPPTSVKGLDGPWSAVASVDEIGALGFGPEQFEVYASDLQAVDRVTGKNRDQLDEWLSATFGTREPWYVTGAYLQGARGWRDELGFGLEDVHSWVSVTGVQQDTMVVHGPQVKLKDGLTDHAPGVKRIGPAEDGTIDVASRTLLRPLGRGLRLASRASTTMVTLRTPIAVDWHQQKTGAGPVAAMRGVAEQLDRHRPISIALLNTSNATSSQATITRPFSTVGIAWPAQPQGDATAVVVYAFADDAAAASSPSEIRDAWNAASIPDLRLLDVAADGRYVVVRLQNPLGGRVLQPYFRQDPPFVHR